ncbi:NAD(P)H-dependent oxidoreductase [Granulicella sp. dw_53]|uniref:FMN-dependent NADH-azoreductase n=1 Tax=Granulicella sp. dw_53 TaxID=2719792 RepID=UPI001BD4318D|nr:NAD(P)H-dependent oxidoreductase [Granulicella sp. dw_53]
MPTLLRIDSSPLASSISRELTNEFVATWTAAHPNGVVLTRDLAASAPAPIDAPWIGASFTPVDSRTAEQTALLALSEQLISELQQADEYVFGVAMHNFSIPSTLKLWIDQVVRAGRTFSYGAGGPQGLLTGKKATILIASGGVYTAGTPAGGMDFVEPYLKAMLGFVGITNIEFITAGGASQLMSGKLDRADFLKTPIERVRSVAI